MLGVWIATTACIHFYRHDVATVSTSRLLLNTSILIAALITIQSIWRLPLEIYLFTATASLFYFLGTRTLYQHIKKRYSSGKQMVQKKHLLIIGAGEAGQHVVERLKHRQEYKVIGFLDDDHQKIGMDICSIPVLSEIKLLKSMVQRVNVEQILIAIPSLSPQKLQQIMKLCVETGIRTQIVPSLDQLVNGQPMLNQVRDVNIEDLLGREEVDLDEAMLAKHITNKTVLVTGAGGSIGSEICRQLLRLHPEKLILLGHGENSIYSIEKELRPLTKTTLIPIIADIKDADVMNEIMHTHRPHIVYHAAAHKHVPLMEMNPLESVKNNILGTRNVAQAAHMANIERFVMISSDKAVDPPNAMGATKRIAEMVIQQLAKKSYTKFAVVRFGNVLGSRGSVIPLFQQQISKGGPVTITDARMTRYFMTIPEAARLVLQASVLTEGEDIFILDMGEPVKIIDLAKNLIRLSGFELHQIPIVEVGIRPGEKLHEVLLGEHEQLKQKVYNKIYVGHTESCTEQEINQFLTSIFEKSLSAEQIKEKLLTFANKRQNVVAKREDVKWKY
ncbi:nucleoside-diphosphate sugar epimerase/dehydratase [Kurthia massiliensis]|uniref:nucleoside-diphosphate sugar epimerase/dehydratase n=1 Tax=Kurthia massiliensis TaxID=1033739 RepID=UPI0002893849|nr:nucleoside-diphosphate sugar epimerase/dehydratase [Kurthia massiliensis]